MISEAECQTSIYLKTKKKVCLKVHKYTKEAYLKNAISVTVFLVIFTGKS